MSRKCQLTGKRRLVGNRVSHSKVKTKMKQGINLQTKKIFDPATGKTYRLRLTTAAIKTLDKVGSISKYLKKYGHLSDIKL